jgi:hypothetical protein
VGDWEAAGDWEGKRGEGVREKAGKLFFSFIFVPSHLPVATWNDQDFRESLVLLEFDLEVGLTWVSGVGLGAAPLPEWVWRRLAA